MWITINCVIILYLQSEFLHLVFHLFLPFRDVSSAPFSNEETGVREVKFLIRSHYTRKQKNLDPAPPPPSWWMDRFGESGHSWRVSMEVVVPKYRPSMVGLPRWLRGKESACQCKRRGFDPWIGKIHWRRKCQRAPVFLPGEFHGQRSLVGNSPWGHKESDTT